MPGNEWQISKGCSTRIEGATGRMVPCEGDGREMPGTRLDSGYDISTIEGAGFLDCSKVSKGSMSVGGHTTSVVLERHCTYTVKVS